MRVGVRKRIYFKIMYFKRIVALFLVAAIFAIALCGFFTRLYKPYIKALAVSKADYIINSIINETVLNIIDSGNYNSFENIIKDSSNRITGVETDTLSINKFKSEFVSKITQKVNKIHNEKFAIPLLTFLNNPFLSEQGPVVYIKVKPVGTLKTDVKSSFESAGVNQTKHQIDITCECEIVIVMPALQIKHKVSTSVPVSQTIIVGEVPQSYTNVSTSQEKLEDTVLQLAGN